MQFFILFNGTAATTPLLGRSHETTEHTPRSIEYFYTASAQEWSVRTQFGPQFLPPVVSGLSVVNNFLLRGNAASGRTICREANSHAERVP